MSLIPTSTTYSLAVGDQGAVVYAIQKALNATALRPENKTPVDSNYSVETEAAVTRFQVKKGLLPDGVFGPASSAEMAKALEPKVGVAIPAGLLRGLVEGESGNLIGAVNWSVAGGVDCSYCQRRVYDSDLNDLAVVRRAFDPLYQMRLFASRLAERHGAFYGRAGAKTHERAWRLATLVHNYPYAADAYASGKWPSAYALAPQAWVQAIGAHFPDGDLIRTPDEWCRHYSLGAPEHDDPGTMTRYVQW